MPIIGSIYTVNETLHRRQCNGSELYVLTYMTLTHTHTHG